MRGRLLSAAGVLLLVGAIAVDVWRPLVAPPASARSVDVAGGILSCPFALAERGRGYLDLSNLGTAATNARITLVPSRGRSVTTSRTVRAGSVARVALHRLARGPASVLIEHAGGELVASHSLWLDARSERDRSGAGAGACVRAGATRTVLAQGRTLGSETTVAVFNPGSADADVSFTLLVDGVPLQPERLSRRVIRPRQRRQFRLGDFAFDTRHLVAIVETNAGRVAAEALVVGPQGVQIIGPQEPSTRVVSITGGSGASTAASVAVIGDEEDSAIEARLMSEASQGKATNIPATLPPGGGIRFGIPPTARRAGAYVYDATLGSPLTAAAAWPFSSTRLESAAVEAARSAKRWGGVLGDTHASSRARVLIANAGEEPAAARIRRISSRGVATEDLVISAGRVLATPAGAGSGVFGIEITSDVPIAVMLTWSVGGRPTLGVLATPATPLDPPPPVAVRVDARAGVPAILPSSVSRP